MSIRFAPTEGYPIEEVYHLPPASSIREDVYSTKVAHDLSCNTECRGDHHRSHMRGRGPSNNAKDSLAFWSRSLPPADWSMEWFGIEPLDWNRLGLKVYHLPPASSIREDVYSTKVALEQDELPSSVGLDSRAR
nr:hypothetical protein [Tanacetum cinerariifolium]